MNSSTSPWSNRMLGSPSSSSTLFRRQSFLLRSLAGLRATHTDTMQGPQGAARNPKLEEDAESIIRRITPVLDPTRHKGQAGKVAVIGGCREYTGAPYFAAISALKIACVSEIMRIAQNSNIPIIIDGDGLFLVTNDIDLVRGYPLAVLTPNVNEYKRLVEKVLGSEVDDRDPFEQLQSLSRKIGGVTILRKGKSDLISDGETVNSVSIFGSPRRCGGQGDILSGSVAVFSSWARQQISASEGKIDYSVSNPMVLGCMAGSALLRKAASLAFQNKKRATLTTDIIEWLGTSLEDICPTK